VILSNIVKKQNPIAMMFISIGFFYSIEGYILINAI